MFNKLTKLALALAFGAAASTASATTFYYDLLDHPDGGASAYSYGARLDHLTPDRFFSFDEGAAYLTYDDSTGRVEISGQMRESLGHGAFGALFDVSYIIEGVMNIGALGSGLFVDRSGSGTGSISNSMETLRLGAKARGNGDYFIFDDDNHRLGNDPDDNNYGFPLGSIVGQGWVDPEPGLTGANDFLFVAQRRDTPPPGMAPIPLPATGWLLIAAVGGLGVASRRRKSA